MRGAANINMQQIMTQSNHAHSKCLNVTWPHTAVSEGTVTFAFHWLIVAVCL